MKFLHLSDLHIGKSVIRFSMLDEQKHIFARIIRYIQTERPGAVVIAGDVYDRAVPSVEAVRLFDDFLTDLAGENIAVLLISGNHDSPERLSYASRLLSEKRLFLRGSFNGTLRPVKLSDEFGEVNFWLLPFVKPSAVRGAFASSGIKSEIEIESYEDALSSILAGADIDFSARNVLVSHQFFLSKSFIPMRSDSELGLDAIDADLISRFDYAALGHLHGAQAVGAEHIRYAGSPLKYSFSECLQEKSVTLVTLKEKGDLTVTALPLKPMRDLRIIKSSLAMLAGGAALAEDGREDYMRVVLTDREEEVVDPWSKVRAVYPNFISLGFENSPPDTFSAVSPDAERIARLSPYDLFHEFFLDVSGTVMSEEQAKIARELLETEDGA
ncbi:MAG: exonuclease SbcCD subunit D [Gracilibacteraceae bacterium]|nr:exonuclease SbcCD subunit D [Gracilibacteraceae bacterium]